MLVHDLHLSTHTIDALDGAQDDTEECSTEMGGGTCKLGLVLDGLGSAERRQLLDKGTRGCGRDDAGHGPGAPLYVNLHVSMLALECCA
jgi:hypothetical protein